jgi:hypothetical protein
MNPLNDGDTFVLIDGVVTYHRCCDCGLVHRWEVKHGKGQTKTFVTTFRDNRRTAQVRRWRLNNGQIYDSCMLCLWGIFSIVA